MVDPADESVPHPRRQALETVRASRPERAVLSGSRGDAGSASDHDVAVFIDAPDEELGHRVGTDTAILFDTSAVNSAKPFPTGGWRTRSPPIRRFAATVCSVTADVPRRLQKTHGVLERCPVERTQRPALSAPLPGDIHGLVRLLERSR